MNKLIAFSILIWLCFSCSNTNLEETSSEPQTQEIADTLQIEELPILKLTKEQDSVKTRSKLLKDSLLNLPSIDLNWDILSDLSYEGRKNEELGVVIDYPVFGSGPLAYSGLEIQIKGYMIPVSETGDEEIFILSAFPYSQCFFCGQAGLESILDIQLKNEPQRNLKLDEQLGFKGKLTLNATDLDYLIYILEDAELIE